MNNEEFAGWPLYKKLNKIRTDGVSVGKRCSSEKFILLYQLDSFYVEIYYSNYRMVVDEIVISKDIYILEPYLDQVQLGRMLFS